MTCTFFGHRDTPENIAPILKSIIIDLIENKNVDSFYVGNQGNFDYMTIKILNQLKLKYPHIKFVVVLAYVQNKINQFNYTNYPYVIYPPELENTPYKYAIPKRNRWMINKSDYVVTYVKYAIGGASKSKEIAEKKKKIIINIGNMI